MLRYAMLCYVPLCYVMLCYVSYAMLCLLGLASLCYILKRICSKTVIQFMGNFLNQNNDQLKPLKCSTYNFLNRILVHFILIEYLFDNSLFYGNKVTLEICFELLYLKFFFEEIDKVSFPKWARITRLPY